MVVQPTNPSFQKERKTNSVFCWSLTFSHNKQWTSCFKPVTLVVWISGMESGRSFCSVTQWSLTLLLTCQYKSACSAAGLLAITDLGWRPITFHFPNPVCSSSCPGDAPESGRSVHADRRRRRRGVCLAGPRPQAALHLPRLRRGNPLHGHVTWPKVCTSTSGLKWNRPVFDTGLFCVCFFCILLNTLRSAAKMNKRWKAQHCGESIKMLMAPIYVH